MCNVHTCSCVINLVAFFIYCNAMKLTVSIIHVSIFTFLSGFGIALSDRTETTTPRVDTPLGVVQGFYKTSSYGRTYDAFEGIPYARPPTGESRFGVARGVSSWTGVLMAKQFGPKCMQYNNRKVEGSEDCLYLNIYTPKTSYGYKEANASRIDLLPVIFFIHGGAFYMGTAMEYKSEYLLDRNVTLVTFNYRLGPLARIANELNDEWETIAPNLLDFNYTVPKLDHPEVARLIKERYLATIPISRSTINQTLRMVNDRLFFYHAEEAARLQARVNRSPVRFYYFSYRGAHSLSDYLSGSSENFGVCHGDDLMYVLGFIFDPMTTPEDRDVQNKLIDLWVSFATEGSPNAGIEWPEVSLNIAGPGKFIPTENSSDFGGNDFWHGIGLQENIRQLLNRETAAERGNSNFSETTIV